MDFVAHNRRKA
jgi:hypothetical protein